MPQKKTPPKAPTQNWKTLSPTSLRGRKLPTTVQDFETERDLLAIYAGQLMVVSSNKSPVEVSTKKPYPDPQADPQYIHLQYVFNLIDEEEIIAREVLENGSKHLHSLPSGYKSVYALLMRALKSDERPTRPTNAGASSPKKSRFSRSDWRRRFVYWAVFRMDEAETLLAKSRDPLTTHHLIREARKCILMAAALANEHTSIAKWGAHRLAVRDARSAKGTAAHRALVPYHAKMDQFAIQFWRKRPNASPREVARAIAPRLEAWMDRQKLLTIDVEISDVARRLKNHQAALIAVAKRPHSEDDN